MTYPLRADRWWTKEGVLDGDTATGRCLGIGCNIWARAKQRRKITHNLRGGGSKTSGWGALRWQDMVGTGNVRFGNHPVLKYLPKKIANYLHEYFGEHFPTLGLPLLPSDRSSIDVHKMLKPLEIGSLLGGLQVF